MSRGTARHRKLEDEFYNVMNAFDHKQWKQFARSRMYGLDLTEYQIDDIQADHASDIREQKYQMLSLWQRKNGRRATIEKLEQLVEDFKKQLSSHRNAPVSNPTPLTHDLQLRSPEADAGSLTAQASSPAPAQPESHRTEPKQTCISNTGLQQTAIGGEERNVHRDSSLQQRPFISTTERPQQNPSTRPKTSSNGCNVDQTVNQLSSMSMKAQPAPFSQFMNVLSGNVNINVTGQHAIGVQNNYYDVHTDKSRQRKPKKEDLACFVQYCSKVDKVEVVPSEEEFYNSHFRDSRIVYKITRKPKGYVLIINNSFPGKPDERHGSYLDARNMETLWTQLGCKVFLKENQTAGEIIDSLTKFATSQKTCAGDLVAVVIMSHGGKEKEEDVFYGDDRSHGGAVKVKEMLDIFNNKNAPRLQGTPKLFFIQSCRGMEVDQGVEAQARDIDDRIENQFYSLSSTIRASSVMQESPVDSSDAQGTPTTKQPTVSDMLVSFATQTGYRAFRSNMDGSWYVNAIVNVFMRHAKDEHVLDMMTRVNNAVAGKTAHNPGDRTIHEGKSMSDFTSTFTKKLYLFPGFPQDCDDDDF